VHRHVADLWRGRLAALLDELFTIRSLGSVKALSGSQLPNRLKGAAVEVRIAVDGRDTDAESLWDWLRNEPELRGRVRANSAPTPDGAMGAPTELVVQAAATMAGAGALWVALSRSLSVWLTQRRSDITVKVTGPDGRQVSLNAKRVADPEKLLREILEIPAQPPIEAAEQ
jgi:Effector Associated Constant Component 1